MNLVNHDVVVINPDSENYGRIGFCESYKRSVYIVLFEEGIAFYLEDELKSVEREERESEQYE